MAVVINHFEAVAEAPAARPASAEASGDANGGAPPDPKDVKPLLRSLEVQALRAWAH